MRAQTALKTGIVCSLLLHASALVVPGWHLPDEDVRESIRIDAKLLAAPSEAAVAEPPAPKPPPRAAARAASGREDAPKARLDEPVAQAEPLASAPVAEAASAPAAAPDQSAAVAQAAQSVPAAAASEPDAPRNRTDLRDWPLAGRVSFDASLGAMPAGEAEYVWSHDALQYNARLSLRSAGLLRLAYRYDAVQETAGRLMGNNLQPERYTEQANTRHFDTRFDAAAGMIRQDRNGAPRELEAKGVALDILSLLHFLGGQPADAEAFDIFVVSPRGSVARVTVLQKGQVERDLPLGKVPVRRFVAEARGGELYIEVDLARLWRNAPMRIYIEDRKQDLKLDLRASQVEIEGSVLARRQAPPPEPDTD